LTGRGLNAGEVGNVDGGATEPAELQDKEYSIQDAMLNLI
jgi:hypothetical protein